VVAAEQRTTGSNGHDLSTLKGSHTSAFNGCNPLKVDVEIHFRIGGVAYAYPLANGFDPVGIVTFVEERKYER